MARRNWFITVPAVVTALSVTSCRPAVAGGEPLVVTRGGTYTGTFASDDLDVPAVTIRTAEPVVIDGAELSGRGTLIAVVAPHADVTVRNCRGTGRNPNVAGRAPGRFLSAETFDRIVIEHCELTGTAGIYLLTNSPGGNGPAVRICCNRVRNIDGRKSDGRGGWLPFNDRRHDGDGRHEAGYAIVQFVQLDKVRSAGMEIGWNEVVNEPGHSRVEDNVNIYDSGGTAAGPLLIHDNYVQGAYTVDPARGGKSAAGDGWTDDWSYSGGGLLLGDGPGKTPATAASFVHASGNVVVGTVNYGIAVAAGHDITFDGNRIVSAGRLPDGCRIPTQNVGAYVWDANRGRDRAPFFDNGGRDNVVGWTSPTGGRNDAWMPDAHHWTGMVALPDPVTPADEAREHAGWLARAVRAGVTIGRPDNK